MTNKQIKISDNCWKYSRNNGDIFYTKASDLESEYHREDGPAVEYLNGDKFWYVNDKYHRLDGPAVEYANGTKIWYINDKRHRLDGPALEHANGKKYWYYHGEYIDVDSQEEFELYVNNLIFI